MNVNKKRFLEVPQAAPELRKDKIVVLKKAIIEKIYQVKADYIAGKILRELFFELALNLNNHEYRGYQSN